MNAYHNSMQFAAASCQRQFQTNLEKKRLDLMVCEKIDYLPGHWYLAEISTRAPLAKIIFTVSGSPVKAA